MPIVILFLSATPAEGVWLKVDLEAREIEHKLADSRYRDHFELVKEPGVSIDEIQYLLLRRRPNIVHFSGHGEVDAIYLQGPDGHAQRVSERALSGLFGIVNKDGNIRCVVLNACYSEEQAKAISEHVECVIGMASAISDDAARGFASSFYQGLAFGNSVNDSFLLGTNYLAMLGVPDEKVPKLHSRQGVDPGKVYVSPTAQKSEPPERTSQPPIPPPKTFDLIGNWEASGFQRMGYFQASVAMRVTFYPNGTFDESGTINGAPFAWKGNFSFDSVRSLLVTQEFSAPLPTTSFLSNVTPEAFTANAPTGILNFRRLS